MVGGWVLLALGKYIRLSEGRSYFIDRYMGCASMGQLMSFQHQKWFRVKRRKREGVA